MCVPQTHTDTQIVNQHLCKAPFPKLKKPPNIWNGKGVNRFFLNGFTRVLKEPAYTIYKCIYIIFVCLKPGFEATALFVVQCALLTIKDSL